MNTSRPYLIRAMFEWINDNDCTPHILVDANYKGVVVPRDFVTDGQIVLNISPRAVRNLILTNDVVRFTAAFNGVMQDIYIPVMAVMGIYARENGQGMMFVVEVSDDPEPTPEAAPAPARKKPTLRVVK